MGAKAVSLPAGFEALQPYVADWAFLDEMGRVEKRLSLTYDEVKKFYDAGAPIFDKVMEYLRARPIGSLTPSEDALFKIALGLVEVSFTFEIYHGEFPPDLYDTRKVKREVQLELPA